MESVFKLANEAEIDSSSDVIKIEDVDRDIATNVMNEINDMINNPSKDDDIDTLILRALKVTVTQRLSELQILEDELNNSEFQLESPEIYSQHQRILVTDVLETVTKVTDALNQHVD